MSDNDTTTPSAEQPTTVAADLHGLDDLHVNGESDFRQSGSVTYEVTAWVDDDADAGMVADVTERLAEAGYDLLKVERTSSTNSVVIKAEA